MPQQNYYRSQRRSPRRTQPTKKRHYLRNLIVFACIIGVCLFVFSKTENKSDAQDRNQKTHTTTQHTKTQTPKSVAIISPPAQANPCAGNNLSQLVLVSISQQHLWACNASTVVYGSAVVTGMENYVADRTPTGTYHIYAKLRDLYLNGSDSTGSWHDYVYYWMPFLNNQYGTYGLHDATWRSPSAFGNISPFTTDASHGCVELPLSTAKWLYGWVSVGTTVTVEA